VLLSFWLVVVTLSSFLIILIPEYFTWFFAENQTLDANWRYTILLLVLANAVCNVLIELAIFPGLRMCARMLRSTPATTVLGPVKIGADAKKYHELRYEFEQTWKKDNADEPE